LREFLYEIDCAMVPLGKAVLCAGLVLFSLWPAPAIAQSAAGGDPCAKWEAASPSQRNSRVVIERDTAADIVKHTQKACLLIAGLIRDNPNRDDPKLADALGGLAKKLNAEVLEYIYGEYPDLRGKDLTAAPSAATNSPETEKQRIDDGPPKMGPSTATYLRWTFRGIQDIFSNAIGRKSCSENPTDPCIRTILDIIAELGFAEGPVYTGYPDLWRLASKEAEARADAQPRTAKGDALLRKAQPKVGSVKLSAAAAMHIRDFLAAVRRDGGSACQIVSIAWSIDSESKGPNDADWTKKPPGVEIGADSCGRIPADVVQTIDGIRIFFGGDTAGRFEDKLVDFDGKQFILKDQ
jgi:hypothetical protein